MNKKKFEQAVNHLGVWFPRDNFVLIVEDRKTGAIASAHSITSPDPDGGEKTIPRKVVDLLKAK